MATKTQFVFVYTKATRRIEDFVVTVILEIKTSFSLAY